MTTGFIYDVDFNSRRLGWLHELSKCPNIDGATGKTTAGYDDTCRDVINWGRKPVCERCGCIGEWEADNGKA